SQLLVLWRLGPTPGRRKQKRGQDKKSEIVFLLHSSLSFETLVGPDQKAGKFKVSAWLPVEDQGVLVALVLLVLQIIPTIRLVKLPFGDLLPNLGSQKLFKVLQEGLAAHVIPEPLFPIEMRKSGKCGNFILIILGHCLLEALEKLRKAIGLHLRNRSAT